MSKGLGRLALLLCLSLFALPAWAASTLVFSANGGATTTYTDSDGTFTVTGTSTSSDVGVNFNASTLGYFVEMAFAPPSGKTLSVGIYDGAQRWPFQSPMQPGLEFFYDGAGCNTLSGRFIVRAISYDGTGNLASLAVDFTQDCLGIVGSYRYNDSTPIPYPHPTADAGTYQLVPQGATVTLDGSLSDGGPSPDTITAYTWTQAPTDAIEVTLSDTSAVKPTFTAPTVPLGGADFTFNLEVDNSVADSSTASVTVHVSNPADPATVLSYTSDSGDYIGGGQSGTVGLAQASFAVTTSTGTGGKAVLITVESGDGEDDNWTLDFAPPTGQSLQAGTVYDLAQRYPFQTGSDAGLSVDEFDRGCNTVTGRFVVWDLQTDPVSGKITAFAADFVQHCEGMTPAFHGQIRYNSTVPLDVAWADAGTPQVTVQGTTVTLSSAGSIAGIDGETISSYQWTQLSGPSVTLSDPTAASPTFATPTVAAGGADLVFQLSITSSSGKTSTDDVTVHVSNPADPVSLLLIDSQPGDTIANGQSGELNTLDAGFSASASQGNIYYGPSLTFVASAQEGVGSWNVQLSLPLGQTLQAGTTYSTQSGARISIYDGQTTCSNVVGQFTLLDLQTGSGTTINNLAADLKVHCYSGATGLLILKLRYNDSVSAYDPQADAGEFQATVQGDTVSVSAAASYAGGPGASITSYQWTQLSGPSVTFSDAGAASPTFTAPSVGPGGSDVVLQVTVTNFLGLTSSATVTVHVAALTDGAPTTRFYAVSDPGDTVGNGQTYDISASQETFSVSPYQNGYELMVGSYDWTIDLVPPTGQTLQVGKTYKLAQRYPFQSPVLPGLSVDGGCNTLTGRFVVLSVETDEVGDILTFAADFEVDCDGSNALFHGFFRYNSGVSVTQPFADAGPAQIVLQEANVQLTGDASFAGGGTDTITSYAWTQLSGPGVSLSDPTAADPTFTAPDVSLGGADLVFQLTVTNSEGLSGSDTVDVHVANPADPVTAVRISGDPGDFVSQGKTWNENTLVAAFTASKWTPAGTGVEVDVQGGSFGYWTIDLVAPSGQVLQAGSTYLNAQRYPFQGSGPGLEVDGNGGGCDTLTGYFIIKDINVATDGTVLSLAADFQQQCDGQTPGLRGKIRYHSTYPLDDPMASAGTEQSVTQGDTVTLDGSATDAGGDGTTITSWQWTQVSGPSVNIVDPNAATASFVPGEVPLGGETLVFQLSVTNSLGLSSTQDVTVLVANPADPQSGLYLQGKPDDYSDAVQLLARQPLDGSFTATTPSSNAVTVKYAGPNDTSWNFTFVPPLGQQFHTGTYSNVTNAAPADLSSVSEIGTTPGTQAQMLIDELSYWDACKTVSGQFTVEQVSYDGNGNVTAFAADFKQICGDGYGGTTVLYGRVRYDSTVTIRAPLAVAGTDQVVFAGFGGSLDGSASSTPYGTLSGYSWKQIVASGDPTVALSSSTAAMPSFTAPALSTGRTLTFQLTVTNSLGLTDQDVVHVQVVGTGDPKTGFYYQSDVDDPDGLGATALATAADGEIYIRGNGYDVDGNIYPSGATAFKQDWEFEFSEGNLPLQKGVYVVGPDYNYGMPWLLATAGACDETGGVFVVRDVTLNQSGQVTAFAADFMRHCQGATGDLRGALRYNSTVPMIVPGPVAAPGPTRTVTPPTAVTLDGSSSFPGWSGIQSFSWRQIAGPKVVLTGSNQAVAQINIPASLLTSAKTVLSFALTVTDTQGRSDTETTQVIVGLPTGSTLSLQSDAGDPVGLGATTTYSTANDAAVSVVGRGGIVTTTAGYFGYYWGLQFAMPKGQSFKVGTYAGAVMFSAKQQSQPGLYVNKQSAAGACSTVSGDFKVLDVQYRNGTVASLALDFDQTCNGASGALHGKLRYHSAVP